jgi:membrane protein
VNGLKILNYGVIMTAREIWRMAVELFRRWRKHDPFQLAAALAYYTIFSLAPLLIIAIGIAGIVFSRESAQYQVFQTVQDLIGLDGAKAIQEIIRSTGNERSGFLAAIIGVIVLLIGAGGVVGQLQVSLNKVWEIEPNPTAGWWDIVRSRFLSYALVLGIGFLLLVSLMVTAVLSAISRYVSGLVPALALLWPFIDMVISFGFVTVLFAIIYKVLPDVDVPWKDVWIGAAITSILFSAGKLAIGIYLGQSSISSSYGAAGSVVTILLWVYYSALIFFFGAEFTHYYSTQFGSGRPSKD